MLIPITNEEYLCSLIKTFVEPMQAEIEKLRTELDQIKNLKLTDLDKFNCDNCGCHSSVLYSSNNSGRLCPKCKLELE